MAYRIREHLYCCQTGDRIVFMDLRKDSYFLLPQHLESAFLAYINGLDIPSSDLERLAALDLLAEGHSKDRCTIHCHVPSPSRSATEGLAPHLKPSVMTIIEVARIVRSTRQRLRNRKIDAVIDHYRAPGCHEVNPPDSRVATSDEERLIAAARDYANSRRFIPIETSCLLDSLAMHSFLSRRRLSTSIVFGVTAQPFSAHAWLQSGNLVLNETVSHAGMHTPIMVL